MAEIGRRGLIKLIGALPIAGLAPARAASLATAAEGARAARARGAFKPQFFGDHEYATVRILADMVIPKDERSGSASDAGVPEFMDFMMVDPLETARERERRQTAMRGGLRWLDAECSERFEKAFLACTEAERKAVLDDIAWPARAKPEHRQGAAFFSDFRDLTASGFWTSRIGIEDLKYMGNVFVAEWKGCPPEVLARLGLEQA
jgi:hypothetical protein